MPAHVMKLVTVIGEALAREAITRLLREVGAHGWTVFPVEGFGAKGERTAEMAELANIQVEVIVPPEVCARLMERLERELFPTYAMIAYEADVRVRRPGKF
jgi:nitrogen regulatory protein PII